MWTCGTFALCCSCEHSGKYSQCGSPSLLQTQPFCVLPAIPSYRGYLQAGNQAQKYGCHGASVSFWGAGGIQELLRDESPIRAYFLAMFAGSCGRAALHQGGVRVPGASPSSESDHFEMGNLVFIKFGETGSWQVQYGQENCVYSHIFTSSASECGTGMLKIGFLDKASVCLCLGWRSWSWL